MRRNIPSLQSLICFESAAKHSSYTHASQELFITQSAVSRQIQQLEEYLGVNLFSRTRHGVELTEAGKQYAKGIKPYLQGIEKSTADIMTHKGLGGTLKLGVVPTFATRWLLPKLHKLNAQHPEITVHLETSTKPFLFNENVFDAAIFAGTQQQIEHWPGIQAHYLMDEEVVPVCSPALIQNRLPEAVMQNEYSYDLSDEELLLMPLLQQTTRPSIWQEWFQAHQIQHPKPFDGQRHELFSMLSVAASHGMGMALIPQMLIESELNKKELVIASCKKLQGSRKYYLVHSSQDISPQIQKFVDWVLQELH
ncbi:MULTISPECIES: LysR substrate-binding domain-containing protein [Acinetobacter]|jgi:LysR family glycine cleavage system transcriptional activator|uniref:LysR substrate-binding domain-containing protein n=1 Tax=Acinetobacter entericus TaxID=2989714 RepID=A0ABT3NJ90_9GAMM|nr:MULTISPECIES: LysR substrate-binding domain-containing protein [Acinetobacter]MCW8039633.1 LysR substrate-binding domain-containing protein [Acinetobacter entericus]TCB76866.1 LysR family transcriptional regulator [Acinetobacter sp. ANC 4177]